MLTERWSVLFLAGVISALAGCGGPSTHVQNQPASPSSAALSISFQAAPPTSTFINTPVNMTAVVNNDPLNAGVDWTLAPCGNPHYVSLSAPHTHSGMPATYQPPASLTTNALAIQILASATA